MRPAIACLFACMVGATPAAAANFTVIKSFDNGADGGIPGYSLDYNAKTGQFFGTTNLGGSLGYGSVFEFNPHGARWNFKTVYSFNSNDGQPGWGVVENKTSLYVNAFYAFSGNGPCGNLIKLDRTGTGTRAETIVHNFNSAADGCNSGNVVVDKAGNIFGVTQLGGTYGGGTVYELSPSNGGWTITILYAFTGNQDGSAPMAGLVRAADGTFFGTASNCALGKCNGTVFSLRPTGAGYKFKTLHVFTGGSDGAFPVAGLLLHDHTLYGATDGGGINGGGTVFELTQTNSGWAYNIIASLAGGNGPVAALSRDASGTLYGTNFMDGANGYGSVFKLTPSANQWAYTDLYDFTGGTDGSYPGGGVVVDAKGNLYGTALSGGAGGWGVVYEITQ